MRRLTEVGRRHPDAVAALLLLLLPVLILGRALLPGKVMSSADNLVTVFPWKGVAPAVTPANPLLWDVTFLFHPSLIYAAAEIRDGRFPLWNPHAFTGAPFFANPQTALLFPLNALAYLLPVPTALTLISILKLSAAGLGMYWFVRLLAVGPLPAFTGAVAFMFNGLLIVWLQWSFASAVVILPLLFGMTERLRQRGDRRTVGGLAVVVALEIFAGYPQAASTGLLALAAWAVYRARGAPHPRKFLVGWAVGVGLGVAIGAVQLLPFIEYLRASSVLFYRSEWMYVFSLPLRSAITFLMPYYYGSPTGDDFWGPANFNEITATVGVLPWVVLPLALLAAWSRAGTKFFFGLLALAAVMLYELPVLAAALANLPPLSMAINTRISGFLVLSLCVLSGLGLDAIRKAPPACLHTAQTGVRVAFLILAGFSLLFLVDDYATIIRTPMKVSVFIQHAGFLALLTLATLLVLRLLRDERGGHRWWLGLVAVQLASVLPLAVTYNPVIDARLLYPGPPQIIRHLQAKSAQDRSRVLFKVPRVTNLGTMFGLFEAGGYDGMTPRQVEQLVDPEGSLDSLASGAFRVTADVSSRVFDLLGIRRVMVAPGAESPAPHFSLEYDGPDGRVYRNDRALPRAFLVFRARKCLDDDVALRLVNDDAIDFHEEVLIAGCAEAPPAGPRGGVAHAEIREYGRDRVVIQGTTDSPAYLVLTDSWFPGWRAWVNGTEHTVWRANHAFRAVWLGPGRHDVEFRYTPAPLRHGLALSLLATLAVAGLFFWPRPFRGA
ncbi:MAG: YfhO family protein [Candidatus Rokubacteria bacterium]|nr:YfhO family protein [Candidatus Rokubacteria bacterium]